MDQTTNSHPGRRTRRVFAWRSALVFVVVGVLTQLLINGVVADEFERSLEFHAEFVTGAIVEPLLPAGPLTPAVADTATAALAAETEFDTQVTAIEVVDPGGVVLLSNDPDRIGRPAATSAGDGHQLTRVPIAGRSDFSSVGVLQDRSVTDAAASRLRGQLAALLLAGLMLLWLVLLPLAHRLGASLQARTDEVEAQRSELARLLAQEQETTQRLTEINQLKDSFLTAISHELRTPLTIVSGMLGTLRHHGLKLSPERRQDLLERADRSAAKLDELLTGLLTLSDPDSAAGGRFSTVDRSSTLDLGEVVAEVRSHLPPHDLELALDAPRVSADRFGLERILANLLGNAIRHAPDGPVRVESERVAGGVEVRVADRGPGVPDDIKQAVYERFRQGELRDSHSPGLGIGLALVARFVGSHGGCTWVSDRPGGGAVFHVRLPDEPTVQEPIRAQAAVCTHAHGTELDPVP